MHYDAIIIGAGAAGLFCAIEAAKRGKSVLLIEHNAQVGRKIIISGGGRCNFTNTNVTAENFISNNPHFCKSALARYTPDDFLMLIKKYRIPYYEKKLGQLFCRERSYSIVEMLLAECEKAGVRILTDCSVKRVDNESGSNRGENSNDPARFSLNTTKGAFTCKKLVIATGGLSFPKIGASGFGYDIARQFGHQVTELRPSLVALRFRNEKSFSKLSGISIAARVETKGNSFSENILFTHHGLSGPAVLQISNYWQGSKPISFDLLPDLDFVSELQKHRESRQTLVNFLSKYLPKRFVEEFTGRNFENKPLNQYSERELIRIAEKINCWQLVFGETEGWNKAEVTLGGVDTNEISSKSMESKKVQGLYFIGEILDVTGWLGGYNLQWAWSSAYVCGSSI
ncbi:MAG: NAD(P)/FAD-dependent oxidoreductase [Acidobacteria bacterium]|nr:NAD(P)/FAD-dependent oxidoreductase [Acidobacteriota bacterium]